ncbi:IQ domain-containing protein IQM1-like isoform X2 [Miscanthus floridulus]|uniref:IQ domain-containing protein IQM1-like isoform X2 n=1 Tax=Miscanthus floridulus TaxID=154761 RepID=UPI00345B2383
MTLRSPPGALDHPKLLQATSPATSSSSRDHRLISSLSVVDDMLPRSPKLLRTNSSKKVPAASNLERALLSFKSWEAIDDANKPAAGVAAAVPVPPASPVQRRIHGARPGRLALHSPTSSGGRPAMPDADTTVDVLRSPLHEAAATRVQKMFKGHRTRRTLADCAIVIEELWWKLYDSASLNHTSISFFTATAGGGKQETAASRWVRAGKRIAKVGKGLSKDDKAQKLALRHWLEAIDPRHRYGHNLHLYYDIWFQSSSTEPFFYWLDIGGGREIHHPSCARSKLNSQLVMYLGMNERAAYQVVVDDGRLTYLQTGLPVNTTDDSKWIFVLSTTRSLYVGQKRQQGGSHRRQEVLGGRRRVPVAEAEAAEHGRRRGEGGQAGGGAGSSRRRGWQRDRQPRGGGEMDERRRRAHRLRPGLPDGAAELGAGAGEPVAQQAGGAAVPVPAAVAVGGQGAHPIAASQSAHQAVAAGAVHGRARGEPRRRAAAAAQAAVPRSRHPPAHGAPHAAQQQERQQGHHIVTSQSLTSHHSDANSSFVLVLGSSARSR